MGLAAEKLRSFKKRVMTIRKIAGRNPYGDEKIYRKLKSAFAHSMNNDLHVRNAFDGIFAMLSDLKIQSLRLSTAQGIIRALEEIDEVLQVIF
jgi:cysteinyl-tRNA synthetase